MKIYIYLKHFPPDGDQLKRATSKSTHGFASGLSSCGIQVTVLCEHQSNSSFQTLAGYTIECFANHKPYRTFTIAAGLKQYIRDHIDNNNSLVILTGMFHSSVYSMSRILKKYRVPYIAMPRDIYHPDMFSKNTYLKWPYWYLFEKRMLQQATAIQLFNRRHEKWLSRLGVENQTIETPNGFSPKDIHPESSLKWRKNEPVRLFFFGRIDAHHKGLDLLLDAFAQIAEITDAKLFIQGPDEGDRKKLEKQAQKLLISEKVSFLEPDYSRSASSIMMDYDILCLPSRFEGFGNTVIEAMLAGRVVLVSEDAGTAPLVQASGCGVVVKPEASTIKSGLIELLQCHSKWKDMGLKGRNYVLEYLHWNKIASAALEQYSNLITSSD